MPVPVPGTQLAHPPSGPKPSVLFPRIPTQNFWVRLSMTLSMAFLRPPLQWELGAVRPWSRLQVVAFTTRARKAVTAILTDEFTTKTYSNYRTVLTSEFSRELMPNSDSAKLSTLRRSSCLATPQHKIFGPAGEVASRASFFALLAPASQPPQLDLELRRTHRTTLPQQALPRSSPSPWVRIRQRCEGAHPPSQLSCLPTPFSLAFEH